LVDAGTALKPKWQFIKFPRIAVVAASVYLPCPVFSVLGETSEEEVAELKRALKELQAQNRELRSVSRSRAKPSQHKRGHGADLQSG
jgi:hypothetical protein